MNRNQKVQLESFIDKKLKANSNNDDNRNLTRGSSTGGGYDGADKLHNVFLDYGYPETLTFNNFWNMYRRFGMAKAIIELPPKTCWVTSPDVISSDKGFLKELETLVEDKNLWQRCQGGDKRQRVGQYAGLFMRVKDGKKPEEPLTEKLNGVGSLVGITPLYESQLDVVDIEKDQKSENFGNPTMYEYRGSAEGDRNPDAEGTFKIHFSRVVITSEEADDGSIYGFSQLEAPYNSLMDLRKIMGAGGEGFYRNAAQSIVFSAKDDSQQLTDQDTLDEFDENVAAFIQAKMRKHLYAPGMEVTALDSPLVKPKEFAEVSLWDVSASTGIPSAIFAGKQTGRLASDQDTALFLTNMQSRRENYLIEFIENVLNWFMKVGILKKAKYLVEWDDLLSLGDKEKFELGKVLSETNRNAFLAGEAKPFSPEEIREISGYEKEVLPALSEEFDEEVE